MKSSRFRRKPDPAGLVLQPRDHAILRAVAKHAFLSGDQVRRLFFGRQSPYQGTSDGVFRACRRLRQLYDHAYLDRFWMPQEVLGQSEVPDAPLALTGSPPTLYCLGRAGVPLVANLTGMPLRDLVRTRQRRPRPGLMAHEYLLNEVRVHLAVHVAHHPHVHLERWLDTATCLDRYQLGGQQDHAHVFNPDGFFRLDVGGGILAAFVEIDRGTESTKRFQGKIDAYRTYEQSGVYAERFGQRHFRVVVVTTSDRRIESLAALAPRGTHINLWFTTNAALLGARDMLTDPIWWHTGASRLSFLPSP